MFSEDVNEVHRIVNEIGLRQCNDLLAGLANCVTQEVLCWHFTMDNFSAHALIRK